MINKDDEFRKVLVLCTGNSAHSQMAEGFFKKYRGSWKVESAGTHPTGLNPFAVKVMAESGIDISRHYSKNVMEFIEDDFDFVITVCDNARESCPVFPGGSNTRYIHWSFEDPAATGGNDQEILSNFRKIRDLVDERIKEFLSIV